MLAPTDAALGQPVLAERRLPSRIRQGLNVESGLNDGICVPLLFIALAFAEAEAGEIGDAHAVRLVVEDGLPYRPASWHLWRDHRVFVPFATIQNWVEAGGEKGAGAHGHRLPELGVGGFFRVCSRR